MSQHLPSAAAVIGALRVKKIMKYIIILMFSMKGFDINTTIMGFNFSSGFMMFHRPS